MLMQRMIVLVLGFLFALSVNAEPIKNIIAFGDSLSDNGNLYATTTALHNKVSVFPITPQSPPYYKGRFSNGLVWIEDLANKMPSVSLNNYAYGGAWAESYQDSNQLFPYDLAMQIDFYLASHPMGEDRENHLFVIWIGGNDYLAKRKDSDERATDNTISVIHAQIEKLIYYGGSRFLILNLPDLGLTPNAIEQGPDFAAKQSHLSELHNLKLGSLIKKLKNTHPDLLFMLADVTEHLSNVMRNPEKYHLKEIAQACYVKRDENNKVLQPITNKLADNMRTQMMNNVGIRMALLMPSNHICQNPDDYLYWDSVHPTRAAHAIMADFAYDVLKQNALVEAFSIG